MANRDHWVKVVKMDGTSESGWMTKAEAETWENKVFTDSTIASTTVTVPNKR